MGTYASVYIEGELLCNTSLDGRPYALGQNLKSVDFNWRSVLSVCKDYRICTVNIKYFNKDPLYVYYCLSRYAKRDFVKVAPDGLTLTEIEILRKGDPNEKFESIIEYFPSELYETPELKVDANYHYNLMNNRVFVRYPVKNFPWVPVEEVMEIGGGELEEITADMCGFLDEDLHLDIYRKVEKDGPISSGRHLLKWCKKATELLPQDPNSWWNYGVSLELAGKINQALESYMQAARLTPSNPKIWLILGYAYLKHNYKEEAHKSFKKAILNIKHLDYSAMGYDVRNNTIKLYQTLLKAEFEDLIPFFNQIIHSKNSFKEIEKIGKPHLYNDYKFEDTEERSKKIVSFRGGRIPQFEADVLQALESQIGKQFSLVNIMDWVVEMGFSVGNNRVTGIGLYGCRVSTLPESIWSLKSLQILDLGHNQLTTLPESIGNLKSLLTLSLEYNQLTTLPESIGQLSSLQKLYLSYNQLSTLPESIDQLTSLQILFLKKNKLSTLPESIGNLKSLQTLSLGNNKLTTLPESIGQLSSLQKLYLSYNQLSTLPESIGNLKSLIWLLLRDNNLSTLPESIGNLESLQDLYLGNNELSTLPESMINITSLRNLKVLFNPLDSKAKSVLIQLKGRGVSVSE